MAYCLLFLLILATLVTQMSNGDKNKCHRAIQDFVKIVASCPKTKKEWDIAASKKNCEQLTSQALCGTCKEPYVYHCVINGFENETLEVCAPRKIIFGYCTEYNVAGGVIQGHKSAKCNSTFPKCGKSYNSTEAYKYPDCYELVYKKQALKTTTYPPEKRTTTSKPDQGESSVKDVMICAVIVICGLVVLFVRRCKRKRRKNLKDEEENHDLIENKQDPSIKCFYIKAKHFEHYHYVNNLAKDCELRLEKVIRDENRRKYGSDKEVMIKVIGNHTDDNLKLLSKVKEEKHMRGGMLELSWKAAPLLCFQNDLQLESALEILRRENACHKILIQSDVPFDKTPEADGSIISVGQSKRRIKEIITSCLEEQLDQVLQDWLGKLKHEDLNKQTSDIIAEIEAIRKQLILDTRHNTNGLDAPCIANKSIVPNDVKEYLFRRFDVNGFGIWGCSTIQIFLKKATDYEILKRELITLNQNFFEKYHLKIETGNMVEKQTLRHCNSTMLKIYV